MMVQGHSLHSCMHTLIGCTGLRVVHIGDLQEEAVVEMGRRPVKGKPEYRSAKGVQCSWLP